ncbi:MAG TPA: ATP-binding protein [Vicinamibacterales bacterium]|nr:ATP-binding protein [Vicinamibacterales bacterium]
MASIPPDIRKRFARTLAGGIAVALLAGGGVWIVSRRAVGADNREAAANVEADVQQRVLASEDTLADIITRALADAAVIRDAGRTPEGAQRLFDELTAALPHGTDSTTGVTVYDATGAPVAWAGRVIDVPRARLEQAPSTFLTSDALGPRLVRLAPVIDPTRPSASQRLGVVVAEELLPAIQHVRGAGVTVTTSPVRDASIFAAPIRSSDGAALAAVEVSASDLQAARAHWQQMVIASALAAFALTLLACAAPIIELRRRVRGRWSIAGISAGVAACFVAAAAVANRALSAFLPGDAAAPYRLLVDALALVALVWLALDLVERRRLARPRLRTGGLGSLAGAALAYAAAGAADASLIWGYEHLLGRFVNATNVDLLHFSLHPLNPERVAISFALVLMHAGVVWTGAFALRVAAVNSRMPRAVPTAAIAIFASAAGMFTAIAVAERAQDVIVPPVPATIALMATVVCAIALARPRGAFRRASQGARLLLLYVALIAPAAALYPSLESFTVTAKERLIAATYAPEALNLRDDLQRQSDRTLEQIDAMRDLPSLMERAEPGAPATERAFQVWSRTVLAEHRITSAIELYRPDGRPLGRFALNLPDTPALHNQPGCSSWSTFEEVSSYAAGDRHVLRAARGVCTREGLIGAIVVRVALDYGTMPFISSLRPYVDPFAPEETQSAETSIGRDVQFNVYGWSQAPLYSFGGGPWAIPTKLFALLAGSRDPYWATVAGGDGSLYRAYFAGDRGGIYALGYPVTTTVGHLINLAELFVLTWVLWMLLIGGTTVFNALTSRTPASGRALLREVRSSFYRKLWLAFVAAAVVPVLILAIATRAYFVNQFTASVKDDAVKTATVAQRLVEDYAALQSGPNGGNFAALDDQVMILVSQAIEQDVNLFDPKHLQATSQPDLFASGALPLRTPDDVYRAVMLNRLPAFVGEETVGRSSYLLAAARIRAGQREGIITVPLTLREQEEDRQVDNLDRQVLFGAVLFVMLGAGVGYWMAERIADPVSRLTRATRRIARGDLDARIAATSSDELRRLVEDFNGMAADLKRQRTELERTQRLEAWADMARQVAHDIKNPLTPIQLSAEHAQRVNIDRGRPLSPVLDECVSAILTQVKLLRQISAEFSSFASSPTPRPEPTDLAPLIEEVVAPYKTGLTGRVTIVAAAAADLPRISLDRTLFARALTNLVENALFAMPGGGRLTISTSLGEAPGPGPGALVVTVTDTGAGMDADALKRIFEPYFSTKATGTGLGLTIAKRNVELNGGTIQVASARGTGTTVTITLPQRG